MLKKFKRKLKKIVQCGKLFSPKACVFNQKSNKIIALLFPGKNLIDHPIFFGFLCCHPIITI